MSTQWYGRDRKGKKGWHRWQLFKEIDPGRSFHTHYNYHRHRRERGETWKYGRFLNVVGWLTLMVAGFAFVPTPGPSYIIIVIGMWMLAGEVLLLARFFDRLDVRLRELGRWIKNAWNSSSGAARVLTVLAILLYAAALGYLLIA